ncbi:MAG: transmembrane anchor protein [Gemmatimonadaceae bacterium]
MSTTEPVHVRELPSSRTLFRSTLIALGVATALMVTVVMPAEYGVDPTGVGRLTGLKEMGEIKQQLARDAATADSAERAVAQSPGGVTRAETTAVSGVAAAAPATTRTDTVRIALAPNQGREIKLAMEKGARVEYSWAVEGGVVNYDLHADRESDPAIKYHGYAKGQEKASEGGELVAVFGGMHGWFWRNRTGRPVSVTLRTSGAYSGWKEIK